METLKREKHYRETVETPEKIVETLGKTCENTMGNSTKWLGNWGNITIIITQKTKWAGFINLLRI